MMRFLSMAIVAGFMLAGAPSGFADTFKSAASKFSANFPGHVEQGEAKDNATDPSGKVISRMTEFTVSEPGRYMAIVIADAYITPYSIQASTYIPHNIKGFLDGIKGTATQQDITFEGNPAVKFSFDTPDHNIRGDGLLVFVPGAMPRAYMVAAMPLPDATAEDKAKLKTFMTSFDID